MKLQSKVAMAIALVAMGIAAATWGAQSSYASSSPVEAVELPYTLHHVMTVGDLFPRGR
jgi:hypothetical protein